MKKIAVFASGTGSNFQAIVEAVGSGGLRAELSLLVCDKPGAAVIEKANAANVQSFVFNPKDYELKSDFETEIVEKLQSLDVDYIILAGYMRLIGHTLLEAYPNKIINIHPSLLPDFPGKDAIGQAMRARVKRTGVTIHYVDEGMDTGPIIAQRVIELSDDDRMSDVERKIHEVEHLFYPETLNELFQKQEEKMKKALISVSDKTGVVEFTKELVKLGYEILSTGGTKKALEDSGISVTAVDEVTGFPEILEGRVKTLHPFIHGGLLAKRDDADHMSQLDEQGIQPIDLVCVNLYPFQQTIAKPDVTPEDAIEYIDIGGPAMLRASAKNHEHLTVVVDSADYEGVLNELRDSGEVSKETKRTLAAKVFRHTAAYDAQIAEYMTELAGEEEPERVTFTYELKQRLRYGENPHQQAAFYKRPLGSEFSIATANQLHGKELSYNNIHDADAALQLVKDFDEPAAVAVKHMNPCGAGVGSSAAEAFRKAYEADPTSIFGGIVAFNRTVDKETASQLNEIFLEIVIAPDFTEEALEVLTAKKNLRLLTISFEGKNKPEKMLTSVEGGLLIQDQDSYTYEDADITIPTKRQPTEEELAALKLAWKLVKHVKSNAIVVAGSDMTLGVGAGQMNRVGAAKIALEQAGERAKGAVLASDAFFPMSDTVEEAAKAGITAIIQPGGSIRDDESIKVADENGIAMVFTGVRHFKH